MNPPDKRHDIAELLRYGKGFLKSSGIESHSLCAELLLAHAVNLDRLRILTDPGRTVSDEPAEKYFELLNRCAANEPLQYIIGKCEFMSLDFYVNPHVLIPRPDTEILVEEALAVMPERAQVLELGTGSGCIAVSLAKYAPGIRLTAVDISREALKTAERNAELNGVSDRIGFVLGDMRVIEFPQSFDMIVSNPPYIRTDDIEGLDENVKDYEPRKALDGGADGLGFFRVISRRALKLLKPGGMLFFEAGAGQAADVREILRKDGYLDIRTINDLAGLERVTAARNAGRVDIYVGQIE